MKLLKLSIESLQEENKKLYCLIKKEYDYDLVIFVARGAYLIGYDIANLNNAPLLEVFAKRSGGKAKKILSPILKILPDFMKKFLREKEFNSKYHENNDKRFISFNENEWKKYKNCKNILLVDDSIDTGNTIKQVLQTIRHYYLKSNIRVASLNYYSKSSVKVKTDYFLYENTMLNGPWSNDSKENKKYLKMYEEWHEKEK